MHVYSSDPVKSTFQNIKKFRWKIEINSMFILSFIKKNMIYLGKGVFLKLAKKKTQLGSVSVQWCSYIETNIIGTSVVLILKKVWTFSIKYVLFLTAWKVPMKKLIMIHLLKLLDQIFKTFTH